jgi:hypothetical protein
MRVSDTIVKLNADVLWCRNCTPTVTEGKVIHTERVIEVGCWNRRSGSYIQATECVNCNGSIHN